MGHRRVFEVEMKRDREAERRMWVGMCVGGVWETEGMRWGMCWGGFRSGWMVGQKGGWAETEGDAGGEGEGLGEVDVGRDGREEGFRLLKMEG